jgi:hypothetical protein
MSYDKYFQAARIRPPKTKEWRPAYVKKEVTTRKDAARENQIAAKDTRDRLYTAYLSNRAARLAKLCDRVPSVKRYLKLLAAIEVETQANGFRDVDQDVADTIKTLKLKDQVPDPYERYLIFEEVSAWVQRVERRYKTYSFDDPLPYFVPRTELSTLDEVKQELEIR